MPNPPDYSAGDKFYPTPQPDPGGERDIPEETKVTLGEYLSDITRGENLAAPHRGSQNMFTLGPDLVVIPTLTENGLPAPFATGGPEGDGNDKFFDLVSPAAKNEFSSTSGIFNGVAPRRTTLNDILDKNSQRDGHALLTEIQSTERTPTGKRVVSLPGSATIIQKKISNVLKLNRFSNTSDTPYVTEEGKIKNEYPQQLVLGEYNANAESASIENLKKVGLSLILKATGHGFAGSDTNLDPLSNEAKNDALKVSKVQSTVRKLGARKWRAKDAFGAPKTMSITNGPEGSFLNYGVDGEPLSQRRSYGQMNSHYETFGGPYPAGQLAAVGAAMVVLLGASITIAVIVGIVQAGLNGGSVSNPGGGGSAQGGPNTAGNPSAMQKGRHIPARGDGVGRARRLMKLMGIPILQYPFTKCLARGLRTFFGIRGASSIEGLKSIFDGDIAQWSRSMYTGSGFYASVIRAAARDFGEISNISEGFDGNIPAQAVPNMMQLLSTSTTLRFFITMATIGNIRLVAESRMFSQVGMEIDDLPNNPATKIAKSRMGGLTSGGLSSGGTANRLAWAHSNNQSRYLIPGSILNAKGAFGDESLQTTMTRYMRSNKFVIGNSVAKLDENKEEVSAIAARTGLRISPEYVHFLENQLELEYMPFYFQDLRTNEIIAFNAFIESMKDSFSADYSSTDGYGRMDPVMIYNKTSRSISVTWAMVATSPEDFDMMWWDINKLTTLVYPQWSKGKTVVAGETRFTMPFSQIPTASPMIRLRIGDVVRSNYSKFALARLFGAGNADANAYNIGGSVGTSSGPTTEYQIYPSEEKFFHSRASRKGC